MSNSTSNDSFAQENKDPHRSIYKARDGNWYVEIAEEARPNESQSTTFGPFQSSDELHDFFQEQCGNSGFKLDETGLRNPPLLSPNGKQVIKPYPAAPGSPYMPGRMKP